MGFSKPIFCAIIRDRRTMSRRNRHKKKKKLKLQKKISQFAAAGKESPAEPEQIQTTGESAVQQAPVESEESESIIDTPTRKLIAKDVRMIIITLLGLAVILVAVKTLQLKTGYINSFGDWLYKITNIQTM